MASVTPPRAWNSAAAEHMLVELVIVVFFAEICKQAAICVSCLQAGCAEIPTLQGLIPAPSACHMYVCVCLPVRLGPGE